MDRPGRPRWWGELLVLAFLLFVYDLVADAARVHVSDAVRHGRDLLAVEAHAHLAVERALDGLTVRHTWLQVPLSYYYDVAHVCLTTGVLVGLYVLRPGVYRSLRTALLSVNAVALGVFFAWPVAPPRLLGDGFVDVVASSGTVGAWEGSATAARHANEYAAMPSLHVAWAVWVLIAVLAATPRRWPRLLAGAHVAVTVACVLLTGNHYVLDAAAGCVLTVAVWQPFRRGLRAPEPPETRVLLVPAVLAADRASVAPGELQPGLREAGATADVVDHLHQVPAGTGPLLKPV